MKLICNQGAIEKIDLFLDAAVVFGIFSQLNCDTATMPVTQCRRGSTIHVGFNPHVNGAQMDESVLS